jgi:DNA-binding NarL/FixJ family response regulator
VSTRGNGSSLRVVVADDHVLFAQCLRGALNGQADIEVVAEVADGLAAVRAARDMTPDLVVMDVSMPGMNGIEATRQIRAHRPGAKVLCLSMHADDGFIAAVLEAGASGYALKDTPLDELLRAIRVVMSGETYLSAAVATKVAAGYAAGRSVGRTSAFSALTSREREVLQLLAEGHTAKAIAARLHLSVKTIGTHREHLMEKLGIHDLAGLTKYAIREGLTSTDRR